MIKAIRSLMLIGTLALSLAAETFAAGGGGVVTADPNKHFDAKGKMPSEYTIKLREMRKSALPLTDKRDFEEAQKGFIAASPYKQIMAEGGHVACSTVLRFKPWAGAPSLSTLPAAKS